MFSSNFEKWLEWYERSANMNRKKKKAKWHTEFQSWLEREDWKDGPILIGGLERGSFGLVGIAASGAAQWNKLLPDEWKEWHTGPLIRRHGRGGAVKGHNSAMFPSHCKSKVRQIAATELCSSPRNQRHPNYERHGTEITCRNWLQTLFMSCYYSSVSQLSSTVISGL